MTALQHVCNRAIANGSPVFVNMPLFGEAAKLQALRMFARCTNYTYDEYAMSGTNLGKLRAEILTLLTGITVPVAKAGVTRLRDELWAATGIDRTGDCIAGCRERFAVVASELISPRG